MSTSPTDQANVRVAIVGTGNWGRQHARVFNTRPDVELCAIVGRDHARAQSRAEEFGTRSYTSIERMLEHERPDLVSVSLPNESHYEPTLSLLKAGVPLLVEKPLVFDLAEADSLLAEAESRQLFFAINFNHRYARPVQLAKEALDSGRLGRVVFATWRFGGEASTSAHPFANLIETQCHGLDMLEHLCGPIATVMAQMTGSPGGPFTTTAVAFDFDSGAVGTLLGSYDSSYAYPLAQYLEINGSNGRAFIEDSVRRLTLSTAGSEIHEVWQAGYFNDRERDFERTFDRHVDALLAAFRRGAPPPVPARLGRRTLVLALAIIESFENGKRVHVQPDTQREETRTRG
jgi:myo-inositol 2-dehydrogenase/D-chiro-inositol 1-dehydrogenase